MNQSAHPWLSANVIASESARSHNISRDQLLGEHLTLNIRKLPERRREFRTQFTQHALSACAPVKQLNSEVLWGVIVETRPLPALEHSVLSVVKKCQIPVQIFHSSANLNFIMNSRIAALVASGTVILTPLNVPQRIAIDGYNALLLSPDFCLPDDFQTAEYLKEHGMVDMVVPRAEQHQKLSVIISLLMETRPEAGRVAG